MNKKSDRLFISGIIIFLISLIAINIAVSFPVRIIFAIGCFIGAIIVLFSGQGYSKQVLWVRVVWWITFTLVIIPAINIFGYLVIDYHHTLPKHIGYFVGLKYNLTTFGWFMLCFILQEIIDKLNKKKK